MHKAVRAAISTLLAAAPAAAPGAAWVAATRPATVSATVAPLAAPEPYLRFGATVGYPTPPTTAECVAASGFACYSPQQLQVAYDTAPLFAGGNEGQGITIALVDSYGAPGIANELSAFDTAFGLPAPPTFKIIAPAGTPPAFSATNATMVTWARETSLDVEYAHAMAPQANLLLVETPVAESEGVAGFAQIVQAENYVISHHLAQVISQSFGATEQTFPSASSVLGLRSAFTAASTAGVTVLASAGDQGPSGYDLSGTAYYTTPVNSWPSTDPLVTSVGGTQLHLAADGTRSAADNAWNDTTALGAPAAGGGGPSSVFPQPSYQAGIAPGGARDTPDVSMSAAVNGAALVYLSAQVAGSGRSAGFYPIGGTSLAAPLFAGIVALADHLAGHGLGPINAALYRMASSSTDGLVDVTAGNTTITFAQGGVRYTVPGYAAVPGYDEATGLGTINAATFVPALVTAVG